MIKIKNIKDFQKEKEVLHREDFLVSHPDFHNLINKMGKFPHLHTRIKTKNSPLLKFLNIINNTIQTKTLQALIKRKDNYM